MRCDQHVSNGVNERQTPYQKRSSEYLQASSREITSVHIKTACAVANLLLLMLVWSSTLPRLRAKKETGSILRTIKRIGFLNLHLSPLLDHTFSSPLKPGLGHGRSAGRSKKIRKSTNQSTVSTTSTVNQRDPI